MHNSLLLALTCWPHRNDIMKRLIPKTTIQIFSGVRYRSPCLAFIFLLSLEGIQVTPWKLCPVHHPLLCAYPSLGCFPVVGALELGQLKLLYSPQLSTHPLEDSESTTKHSLAEWIQSVQQFNRVRVLYLVFFHLPKLFQTCSAQKQILLRRLHCLRHFLNWKSSSKIKSKINK